MFRCPGGTSLSGLTLKRCGLSSIIATFISIIRFASSRLGLGLGGIVSRSLNRTKQLSFRRQTSFFRVVLFVFYYYYEYYTED